MPPGQPSRKAIRKPTVWPRRAKATWALPARHVGGGFIQSDAAFFPVKRIAPIADTRSGAELENKKPIEAEEAAQLGVTHAQVGAYLLGLWGMPAHLVEAAALHYTPRQSLTSDFSVLTAVHVANVLAHEEAAAKDSLSVPSLDESYLSALGLPTTTEGWRQKLSGETQPATPTAAPAAAPVAPTNPPPLATAKR